MNANKLTRLIKSPRILILIAVILLSLLWISPSNRSGVTIDSILIKSPAAQAGIQNPIIEETGRILRPTGRERITTIDITPIKELQDFYNQIQNYKDGDILTIYTTKNPNGYKLIYNTSFENQGLSVNKAPLTNLEQGIDLTGGVSFLLAPKQNVTVQDLEIAKEVIQQRANVFGLSDISVKLVQDKFILIEIAGKTDVNIVSLLSSQGQFEAKIGNDTVFVSEGIRNGTYYEGDIRSVCKSADCAGIESCAPAQDGGQTCRFSFQVGVSTLAAKKHAEITRTLSLDIASGGRYLSKPLDLFVDGELLDSLQISSNLKGIEATTFVVQGSGFGETQAIASKDAQNQMKKLQAILETGSIVELEIVRKSTISASLGENFLQTSFLIFIIATVSVAIILFFRYLNLTLSFAILTTMFCEIFVTLGIASLLGWQMDLASLAGLLVAVGTGVNDQIVVTDEIFWGKKRKSSGTQSVKNAFFIILAAYFTALVSMIPLFTAGAGEFKGFAFTTIIGITVGVLITRPAFAEFMKIVFED